MIDPLEYVRKPLLAIDELAIREKILTGRKIRATRHFLRYKGDEYTMCLKPVGDLRTTGHHLTLETAVNIVDCPQCRKHLRRLYRFEREQGEELVEGYEENSR
jgi:hypothetical protein